MDIQIGHPATAPLLSGGSGFALERGRVWFVKEKNVWELQSVGPYSKERSWLHIKRSVNDCAFIGLQWRNSHRYTEQVLLLMIFQFN